MERRAQPTVNRMKNVQVPAQKLFTASEVASFTGLSASTVCRDIREGLLVARSGFVKRGPYWLRCHVVTNGDAKSYVEYKRQSHGGYIKYGTQCSMFREGWSPKDVALATKRPVHTVRLNYNRWKERGGTVVSEENHRE